MARPRIPKGFVPPKASATAPDYSLIPTKRPHHRSQRDPPLIYLANGQVFTQDPQLPTKPGQIGVRDPPLVDLPSVANHTPRADNANKTGEVEELGPLWGETADNWTPHVNKRNKQAQRWTTTVLPQLVPPYMELLRETDNLHLDPNPSKWLCSCGGRGFRLLNIVVVRFARLSEITLEVCDCISAGEQLIQMGLFPCAPCYPTLAVDIRVLEFVEGLFLRVAPNHRAWCDTVTDFLENQGYRMRGQDPLRRRFSNAFQWYTSLKLATKSAIDRVLSKYRDLLPSPPSDAESVASDGHGFFPFSPSSSRPPSAADVYEYPPESSPPSSRPTSPFAESLEDQDKEPRSRSSSPDDDEEFPRKRERLGDTLKPLTRPSEYLRSRCPTCYGGWDVSRPNELGFDAIVCIDACFTQKHNKTRGRDPVKKHPDTKFMTEEELRVAEEYVESIRPSESRSKQGPKVNQTAPEEGEGEGEEDGYEGTMKVPRSALKGCHKSFTAADERRQKASTQFFDCTGVMGLLCRHDRVLWLANMTSAGEKQFYVIALIQKLFEHLPESFQIGLLYDIGCQLDSSCEKWGLLDDFWDHLAFAISVFHAFGHHWACQLIYHPRKCEGFGFSDGEGCERFWHSISRLIPYLRVCGYHQRIYTLDCQVKHDNRESLKGLGEWLARKLTDARGAQIQGQRDMESSGRSEAFLRRQWEEQRTEQTKPLPSKYASFVVTSKYSPAFIEKSNALGKKAVQEVMRLRTSLDLLEQKSRELEEVVMDLSTDDWRHDQAVEELPQIQNKVSEARKMLKAKERLLGVKDTQAVRHLQNSPFLRERMKALALKNRLVALLRARKFQRDRLERLFRKNSNEAKLHSQIAQSVKRKDPGIQKVARSYNALVKKLKDMIRRKNCPRHATAPREIPMDKLFALDVDDKIWEDVGLTDEWDRPDLPLWLADDDVRAGIRAMLQHDRAEEEIARLMVERDSMQTWFAEEWLVVSKAIEHTIHPDIQFQLELRRQHLLQLCVIWQLHISHLPPSPGVPEWGPTERELAQAKRDMEAELLLREQTRHADQADTLGPQEVGDVQEGDDGEEDDMDGDEYDEDVNTIETFDIVDEHETLESNDYY